LLLPLIPIKLLSFVLFNFYLIDNLQFVYEETLLRYENSNYSFFTHIQNLYL